MLNALSAETTKLLRHKASWFLVWIYPVVIIIVFLIVMAARMAGAGEGPSSEGGSAADWARQTAGIWNMASGGFGRYMIAGFVAVAFAGEYGWNTWKLIVPHRSRLTLLLAKYIVVFGLLYFAFWLTGMLTAGLTLLGDTLLGDALPNGLGFGTFIAGHWRSSVAALPAILFTIALTSLAAILTRSTIASLIIAVVVITAEQVFGAFVPQLYGYVPQVVGALYRVLPGYHLANVANWVREGAALVTPLPGSPNLALGWQVSLAATLAWIGGVAGLTLWRFQRQDIN